MQVDIVELIIWSYRPLSLITHCVDDFREMEQGESVSIEPGPFTRPYRSHKVPACERCRRRKGRCVLDVPGGPCRHCRERRMTCNYQSSSISISQLSPSRPPAKRARQNEDLETSRRSQPSESAGELREHLSKPNETPAESSIIMDPHMSEDIALLEHYLSGNAVQPTNAKTSYSTISSASGEPVVYLTVPRKRKGLSLAVDPGRTQREIIEQILHPFTATVCDLYFQRLHPCFPILDEKTFRDLWLKDRDLISSTLLCDLYTSAVVFWKQSELLCQHQEPDINFLWNTAVKALQDDFLAPTLSTVHSALLDMIGRPVGAVTGNIVNAGRVVTLAQSLGLHRDPTNWKMTKHEKHIRIRLWWGVRIHDHWASVGHGTPPTINPDYSDVPLPDLEALVASGTSEPQQKALLSFYHLCKLTQILGDILPHVYTLRTDLDVLWRTLRKTEFSLDEWILGLPQSFRDISSPSALTVNGSANLWFCYLWTRVLICRLAFKATLKESSPLSEARQYRLALLREASCAAMDFIISLKVDQFQQFWLPYTSYLLVTIATVLLRCIVEYGAISTKRSCVMKVIQFRDHLVHARNESNWDLATFCLERYHETIQRIADALPLPADDLNLPSEDTVSSADTEDLLALGGDPFSEQFLQIDLLDCPWETLWASI